MDLPLNGILIVSNKNKRRFVEDEVLNAPYSMNTTAHIIITRIFCLRTKIG